MQCKMLITISIKLQESSIALMASLLLLNSKCNETLSRDKITPTDDYWSCGLREYQNQFVGSAQYHRSLFIVAPSKCLAQESKKNADVKLKTVEQKRMKKNSTNIFFQLRCSLCFMMIQNFNSLLIPLLFLR